MAKEKAFYHKIIHQIPVYLSKSQTIDFKNAKPTKSIPDRIDGFDVYKSQDSYCFGSSKPISKLIENENGVKIL
ncbi:MAG: hypothetical protein ACO1N0_01815 [Fluviicola sp.]